jgi:hypothetical protein
VIGMVEARAARRVVAVLAAACLVAVLTGPRAGADPAAGPVVGPEHPVSDPIESPSANATGVTDIAFDGTNYLVVWADSRNGRLSGSDIYGARVTPGGALLDPIGIRIGTAPGDQSSPSVAFGGGSFLVVWSGFRQGESPDVHGARVSAAGTVLDPSPIPISTAPESQVDVDVAYGDGTFLAVWADGRSGTFTTYGSRVTPSGSVLDDAGIAISPSSQPQYQPAAAFGGGSFLVAWADLRADPEAADVFGARVDLGGAVLDPAGIPIATGPADQRPPDLAFNGTHHLVTWQEYLSPGWQVSASRVDPTGAVVDPSPITVAPLAEGSFVDPAVTALGSTFLVAWQAFRSGDQYDALAARIASDGTNLDPNAVVISLATGRGGAIGVATGRSNYFAVWADERIGRSQAFGTSLGPDGVPSGPGTLLTRSANQQRGTAIAFDGTNHLVVWSDSRSGARDEIMATRLTPSGRRVDGSDILVSGGGSGWSPSVVYDGDFVVAWQENNRVFLARVDTAGNVVGPPIALPEPPGGQFLAGFALAANHLGVLVTWTDVSRGESAVRAVRVARDGAILDTTPIVVATAPGIFGGLGTGSVGSDGQSFLVAWPQSGGGVRGTLIAADGTVQQPGGSPIAAGADPWSIAVAWNGRRYLVVWNNAVGGELDVNAARVAADGAVQDTVPIEVSTEPLNQSEPVVSAGTGPFLVAWRETDEDVRHDIRAARVGDDGAVLDTPSFAVATASEPELGVALSPGPEGTWGAAYARYVPESPLGVDRVFFRHVAPK